MEPGALTDALQRSISLTHAHSFVQGSSSQTNEQPLASDSASATALKGLTPGDDTVLPLPVRSNRFSLTFPIAVHSRETSPIRHPPAPAAQVIDSTPTSSSDWLTAIAAQERRVLDIKEELLKAEAELNILKLQWTTHEEKKKKDDAKKTTRLRPLSTTLLPETREDMTTSSSAWLQHETERRKVLMTGARQSSRRVFSGSKHTRTLSLLAPLQTKPQDAQSQHRPRGATSPVKNRNTNHTSETQLLPRAATTPALGGEANDIKLDDMLLKTGKKMAMDLKDGIWTFWEDLRQATVGEESTDVVPQTCLRQQSSPQALRTPRRSGTKSRGSPRVGKASVDPKRTAKSPLHQPASPRTQSTESQFTSGTPVALSRHTKAPSVAISAASSDAFDAWEDSPKASCASSATSDGTSHLTPDSSKHTSPVAQLDPVTRDPIPWPNIKSGPATLRRTASFLMSEWDKLSPPPKEEIRDYLESKTSTEMGKAKKQD